MRLPSEVVDPGADTMATMSDFAFDLAMASRPVSGDRRAVTITHDWDTPNKTPNGGYVLAVMLEAARHSSPHSGILNASVNYLRPATVGENVVRTELVRTGRRTATVRASLAHDGDVSTIVTATFVDRDAAIGGYTHTAPPMPTLPPPEKCVDAFAPLAKRMIPIADHFEYRHAEVPGWTQGRPSGQLEAVYWTRFTDGRDPDELSLATIADAYPPLTAEIGHLASATIQLTVSVFRRPVSGWLLAQVRTRHVIDSFHDEDVELWDSSGHLVAQSRQLALLS